MVLRSNGNALIGVQFTVAAPETNLFELFGLYIENQSQDWFFCYKNPS